MTLFKNIFLVGVFSFLTVAGRAEIRIHVIDVGYGSAVHLEAGVRHFLFDVGPADSHSTVMEHLSSRFVTRLDGIFLTHTHPDHVGALGSIVSQIKVDRIFWNKELPGDEDIVTLLHTSQKLVSFEEMKPGTTLKLFPKGSVTALSSTLQTNNLNDSSLVFLLKVKKHRLLIAGDAEEARQKNLAELESERLQKVRWLLWPHHGDRLEPSFRKLLINNDFCVVSLGPNPWGMPADTLESDQKKVCQNFYRTDETGTISFVIDRKIQIVRER